MKLIKVIFILTAFFLSNLKMQAQTLSLTASNYNGFNVSCFGEKNGSIDLTITGGIAPYSILWSTSNIDADIDSLPAGYYRVVVDDADTLTGPVAAEITLTEPRKIEAEIFIHTYNDRYNISAFDACNGIISFQPAGGVSPYQYLWNDNNTTNNRSNLCADRYIFLIEDANQCKYKSEYIILVQPDRNDWQMNGNENTDPLTHFIGTMDSVDFVFRTNGIERLRLGANGSINFGNNLNVGNTLNFSNNKVIDYKEADAASPEVMSFGNRINSSLQGVLCSPTQATAYYQFSGLLQSWGIANSGGNLNMMQFGFDGENSVIDAAGNNSSIGNHRLLLNYNCGKDVFVGNPSTGGNLTANRNFFTLGSSQLDGIVLIGTSTNFFPERKLVINGSVRMLNAIGPDQLEFFASDTEKPYRRGITIGSNPNGYLNFWINGSQGQSSFNFRDSHNGATLMTLSDQKLIGLGITDPSGFQNSLIIPGQGPLIHIKGSSPMIRLENDGTTTGDLVISNEEGFGNIITNKGLAIFIDPSTTINSSNYFTIIKNNSLLSPSIAQSDILFKVNSDGYVGARGIKVTPLTFPDYVFHDGYNLLPLYELEKYIAKNKKLPNIPSQEEVINNGLDLGDLVVRQMEKIEELTLYIIELNEKVEQLKSERSVNKN